MLSLLAASVLLGPVAAPQAATVPPRPLVNLPESDPEPDIMKIIDRNKAYADPRIALQKLMRGNRRFVAGKSIHPRQGVEALKEVASGQQPFATILGCSDSRVPAEIIFDQGLGDLFLVRTAGQVSTGASYGSMEFAAAVLKTKLIVVLGHEKCGAVDAAIKRPESLPGHIVTLVNGIKSAVAKTKGMAGDPLENAIRQNVIDEVEDLRDLEPILGRAYKKGEILIVGAVYHLGTGRVEFIPETLRGVPEFAGLAEMAKAKK